MLFRNVAAGPAAGRRQLQRWLQISLYANAEQSGNLAPPLLMLASTRGKLLELMAAKLYPEQPHIADIGFMSLMDALSACLWQR